MTNRHSFFHSRGQVALLCALSLFTACKSVRPAENSSQSQDVADHNGYKVFKWPSGSSISPRNHDALGDQMTQYATLVGKCYAREPKGAAESQWAQITRRIRISSVEAAAGNSGRWCDAVVKNLVESYTNVGGPTADNQFCQFGNCWEGSVVGACLAKAFDFGDDEIRLCHSPKHDFAMVSGPQGRKWCILDRWNVIGFFACGVDWDPAQKAVTVEERIVSDQDGWLRTVQCATLNEYMRNPSMF